MVGECSEARDEGDVTDVVVANYLVAVLEQQLQQALVRARQLLATLRVLLLGAAALRHAAGY